MIDEPSPLFWLTWQTGVRVASADGYLTLVAAEQTVRAAQAGVERAPTVAKTITAQAKAELRPGTDELRAEAELAWSQAVAMMNGAPTNY